MQQVLECPASPSHVRVHTYPCRKTGTPDSMLRDSAQKSWGRPQLVLLEGVPVEMV